MRKDKYLIINDLISGGGTEIVMRHVINKLLREGHDVTVSTFKGTKRQFYSNYSSRIKYHQIEFKWYDSVRRFSWRWFEQNIKRIIYKIRKKRFETKYFDKVIAMKEGPSAKYALELKANKRVAWIQVDYRYLYWTKHCFGSREEEFECLKRFDDVICVSNCAADGIAAVIGKLDNVNVCYNPIDTESILNTAEEYCDMTAPLNKKLFISVGRLSKEKRFDMLVEVANRLSSKYNFELWIVGDGPEKDYLQRYIEDNELHFVKLLGQKSNPYPYIKQADCFISTSITESFGLAIQEALILGVPVIATECQAMFEFLPPEFGKIIPNDDNALYDIASNILDNPSILSEYKSNIKNGFDMNLYDSRLNKIYNLLEN